MKIARAGEFYYESACDSVPYKSIGSHQLTFRAKKAQREFFGTLKNSRFP